jgi:hypothetical protein
MNAVAGAAKAVVDTAAHATLITSFVFIMMVLVEYLHVQTGGRWQRALLRTPWRQCLAASVLGAVPGCLGAFTVVSLYAHGSMSFGALVAAMIATSGDEAFVMFSMIPGTAAVVTAVLFATGLAAGILIDRLAPGATAAASPAGHELALHEAGDCNCFPVGQLARQLQHPSFHRVLILALLALFLFMLAGGAVGPDRWNWVRITLLSGGLFALFVALTVPDHFLTDHIWEHILVRHLRGIFIWTFGALLVIEALGATVDTEAWIRGNSFVVLLVAVAAGWIPQSGPHLVFLGLYADGLIPLAVLLANSISQDGHGALPLLAVSRRDFLRLKLINSLAALAVGLLSLRLLD